MRAPDFWFSPPQSPDWRAKLLTPLSQLTRIATARRLRQTGHRLDVPVICVGNINAGGTGKTPTVIAVVERLQARGLAVHIVSRGHGGTLAGPVRVDPAHHTADATGDEPLMLATFAPTWIAKDRAAGGRAAVAAGAQVVVLDDGHQNPALHKDLTLIVVDAAKGFGNGRCLPAGPLREPLHTGLARGDLLLSIGAPQDQDSFRQNWGQMIPLPHMTGALVPRVTDVDWATLSVVAFAGIGHPEKFFDTLRALGANMRHTEALADHQPFTPALLDRLQAKADDLGACLVTTEKDAARLPEEVRKRTLCLPVQLQISDDTCLQRALDTLRLPAV